MINVNQITAKLATLPDQALQQYAMMNKNDPYIMSLAMSESTRRQEIRTAAQGAQGGMQEPPKVVDQAIAGMAPQPQQMPPQMGQPMPEDSGIGQLPAGDMEFAEGGILAFAEGRTIPGAAPTLASRNPQAMRLMAPLQEAVDLARKQYEGASASGDKQAQQLYLQALTDAQSKLDQVAKEQFAGSAPAAVGAAQDVSRNNETAGIASDARAEFSRTDPRLSIPPATPMEAPTNETGTSDTPNTPAAPSAGISSLPSTQQGFENMYGLGRLNQQYSELEAKGRAVVTADKQAALKDQKQLNTDLTALGEYGVEREKLLNKQMEELAGKEDKNVSMALLEAGLAMMSGTSQYAFENIGKGALVGTKAYTEGVDKIDARRTKLDDALANLQDIRRGEKRATMGEKRAAQAKVDSAEAGLARVTYDVAKDQIGMTQEVAKTAANSYVTSTLQRAQIASADRRAAMPSGEQRALEALDPQGKGDARRGYEEQQRIKSQYSSEGRFNMDTAYADYLNKNQQTAALSGQPLLSKSQFAAMFGAPPATATPTGVVRD